MGGRCRAPSSGCPLLQPQPRHPDVPPLCSPLRAMWQPWLRENLCLLWGGGREKETNALINLISERTRWLLFHGAAMLTWFYITS